MEMSRRKRIGVLVGGESPEREISLASGEAVLSSLRDRGWEAVQIFVDRDLDMVLRQERVDVAFIALAGRAGDGAVQGLCETLGIPYTGSSLSATALAADKLKSKEVLRLHNLPTPAYYRHTRGMGGAVDQHHGFGFPCVVKPRAGSSGIGVAVARDGADLEAAVEVALRLDDDVLIERHVTGCEVQVVILDGQVLGVAELVPEGGMLDYATRFTPGRTQVIVPPRLGHERLRGVVTQALRAHHLFGCEGVTRVDMVVSDRDNESILELDTLPDLAPGSLVSKLAHAANLDYTDLVERVLDGARLHLKRRMRERREMALPFATEERRTSSDAERH